MTELKKVKAALRKRPKSAAVLTARDYLSLGATPLNLACSGHPNGAIGKGHYALFVGDSASGKTMLAMTMLAEACKSKAFDEYNLVFDASENGMLMDVEKFFGKSLAERIQPPARDAEGNPLYSQTIEEMYYNIDDRIKAGKPFIYVEDSVDALDSVQAEEKFEEQKEAYRAGKDAAGSYGDGKAKKHSETLRKVVNKLPRTGSILLFLSQTRDNINPREWEKKTRAGGRALRFYSHVEMWSTSERISKTVNKKKRHIGIKARVTVKKNRYQGWEGAVDNIFIYRSFGVDDVGSTIEYLIEEGHWSDMKGKVTAPEFEHSGTREALIKLIEEANRERELKTIATTVWREIEAACEVKRKPRYQ